MYFVTDNPILFNTDTGIVINIEPVASIEANVWEVIMGGRALYMGTRWECEDFIYSIAGWVGAVNPVTLEKAVNDEL